MLKFEKPKSKSTLSLQKSQNLAPPVPATVIVNGSCVGAMTKLFLLGVSSIEIFHAQFGKYLKNLKMRKDDKGTLSFSFTLVTAAAVCPERLT